MISLNDAQLKAVMAAAAGVPIGKRDLFLRSDRLDAGAPLRPPSPLHRDVEEISQRALVGLVHEHEPAA